MANTFKKIQTVTVGSGGASTIEFTSIPQTYTDLKLVLSVRNSVDSADGIIEFNGSTTSASSKMVVGDGSNVASYTDTANYFAVSRSSYTASVFGNVEIYIPNYTSANYKSLSIDSAPENNATATSLRITAGLWSNTAAITSIKLTPGGSTPTWVQYSTATLYGIANVPAAGNAKATGGIITYDDTYVYHSFPWSGTFTPLSNLTADYLVVAGGGGGGGDQGGGGGAGGLRCTVGATGGGGSLESALSLTANTGYTVTVGAGGAGASGANKGSNGANSVFSSITSTGGGGGGYYGSPNGFAGNSGGSGGGGGNAENGTAGAGGAGTANQGYAGGAGGNRAGGGTYPTSGGGGGAGAIGQDGAKSTDSADGGIGVATTISGSSTYYAGGGGGWISSVPYTGAGIGGSGGGADGKSTGTGNNGTVNTGGGGGGTNAATSGSGGSGIVIVRYAR